MDASSKPLSSPEISIVIPTFGGQETLRPLAERISDVLKDRAFEILFVHDCGPDDSWRVITDLAKGNENIRGINLRRNFGQHNAVLAGLNYVRGRIIITMDDDLQHSPNDIPALCTEVERGHDVCYAKFETRKHALWKRLGSRINDYLARFLLGKPKDLYLSPYRCFNQAIRDELIKYKGPSVYLDGLILNLTNNITSVPVAHYERSTGTGHYSLRRSIRLLLQMATSGSIAPLRLAALLGVVMSFAGFVAALLLILQRFTINAMPIGWSSLIVTSLILGGVQLLALGVLGEYLGRLFLHVNARPQFVVSNMVNVDTEEERGNA